jgi:hypothetical protein
MHTYMQHTSYVHTCMHAYIHTCIHMYTYIHTYVYTYIHTYMHTHIRGAGTAIRRHRHIYSWRQGAAASDVCNSYCYIEMLERRFWRRLKAPQERLRSDGLSIWWWAKSSPFSMITVHKKHTFITLHSSHTHFLSHIHTLNVRAPSEQNGVNKRVFLWI